MVGEQVLREKPTLEAVKCEMVRLDRKGDESLETLGKGRVRTLVVHLEGEEARLKSKYRTWLLQHAYWLSVVQ